MKPEHFCSGNAEYPHALGGTLSAASMKPEHFCSGNGIVEIEIDLGLLRFNEAGAFLLRKLASRELSLITDASFNEAGAFLLRKPAHALRGGAGGEASMKPEHFCSGNRPCRSGRRPHPARFNEAGAFLLRKRDRGAR